MKLESAWLELMKNSSLEKDCKQVTLLTEKGIPESVRGQAWIWMSGMERNDEYYYKLLKQKSYSETSESQIKKDVPRTIYRYNFSSEEKATASLTNILLAFVTYHPNIGYISGMSFVAALLLSYVREEDAFWLLIKIFQDFSLERVWNPNTMAFGEKFFHATTKLTEDLPVLKKIEEPMIMNILSKFYFTVFTWIEPSSLVLRIWDTIWLKDFDYLYALMYTMISLSDSQIKPGTTFEEWLMYWNGVFPFNEDEFISSASKVYKTLPLDKIREWEREKE